MNGNIVLVQLRMSHLQEIAKGIWSKVGNHPVILIGDLNSRIGENPFEYLVKPKNFYSDATYHINHKPLKSYSLDEKVEVWNFSPYNDFFGLGQTSNLIDHILPITSPAYNVRAYYSEVEAPFTQYTQRASDHPAIMASVELPDEKDFRLINYKNYFIPIFKKE